MDGSISFAILRRLSRLPRDGHYRRGLWSWDDRHGTVASSVDRQYFWDAFHRRAFRDLARLLDPTVIGELAHPSLALADGPLGIDGCNRAFDQVPPNVIDDLIGHVQRWSQRARLPDDFDLANLATSATFMRGNLFADALSAVQRAAHISATMPGAPLPQRVIVTIAGPQLVAVHSLLGELPPEERFAVDRLRNAEHFEWLVRCHINRDTFEEIAQDVITNRGRRANPRTISAGAKKAAGRVGIVLKPPTRLQGRLHSE